jgi:hypothetical protein
MRDEKSVFDRVKNNDSREILLRELQNELAGENCVLEVFKNDPFLRLNDNEATLQAEFYHYCKLRQIPCYLEVFTFHGKNDAIIIYPFKIIIEFKMVKKISEILNIPDLPKHAKQLNKYLRNDNPVLIITNKCNINMLMCKLKTVRLSRNLYYYNQEDNNFFILSHKKIKKFTQG